MEEDRQIIAYIYKTIGYETQSNTVGELVNKYKSLQQELSKANDKLKKIERIIETDSLDVYTKEHGNITVISIETVGEIIEGND